MARRWMAIAAGLGLVACGGGDDDGGGGGGGGGGADATLVEGWRGLPGVAGGAVQETAAVELGGVIYVIGGIDGGLATTAAVRAFDVAGEAWLVDAPSLPTAVHHANAAVVDGSIYVLGALAPGFDALAVAWRWSPGDASWTDVAAPPSGSERGAAAVGVIDGKVYLAGGLRGGAVADVAMYDPVGDAWTTGLAPLPSARDHLTGQAVGGRLYAIGGRAGSIESVIDDVVAYDPATDAWTAVAAMPTARGGTASGVVDGAIVVVGGEGDGDDPAGVFDEVERYDPAADAWTSLPAMPRPRHGMAAVGIGGALYVPGGADRAGFAAVDTFEVYTP